MGAAGPSGLHSPWKEPIITATEMQYVDNLGEGEANMRDRASILVEVASWLGWEEALPLPPTP